MNCINNHIWTLKNNPYAHCIIVPKIYLQSITKITNGSKCLRIGIMLVKSFLQIFFKKGGWGQKISITKLIFLVKQINKMTNITLYSDLKRGRKKEGGKMDAFKFLITIFGPKCGKTHYVALNIHVCL